MKPARTFQWLTACVVAGVCAVVVAGCSNTVTAPSGAAVFTQTDLRIGSGAEAVSGSTITVRYTGWFYDQAQPNQKGLQFDSSVGSTGFTFTLGTGAVIAGWDQGVVGMKEGGLRRLVIPPALAYGSIRNGPIPPNSTLVFEIELVTVQ